MKIKSTIYVKAKADDSPYPYTGEVQLQKDHYYKLIASIKIPETESGVMYIIEVNDIPLVFDINFFQ